MTAASLAPCARPGLGRCNAPLLCTASSVYLFTPAVPYRTDTPQFSEQHMGLWVVSLTIKKMVELRRARSSEQRRSPPSPHRFNVRSAISCSKVDRIELGDKIEAQKGKTREEPDLERYVCVPSFDSVYI